MNLSGKNPTTLFVTLSRKINLPIRHLRGVEGIEAAFVICEENPGEVSVRCGAVIQKSWVLTCYHGFDTKEAQVHAVITRGAIKYVSSSYDVNVLTDIVIADLSNSPVPIKPSEVSMPRMAPTRHEQQVDELKDPFEIRSLHSSERVEIRHLIQTPHPAFPGEKFCILSGILSTPQGGHSGRVFVRSDNTSLYVYHGPFGDPQPNIGTYGMFSEIRSEKDMAGP